MDYKIIGIRKFELVAKTQLLYVLLAIFMNTDIRSYHLFIELKKYKDSIFVIISV